MMLLTFIQTIECTTPAVNPGKNCVLWVMRMHHSGLIGSDKCAILAGDVDNGRGDICVGARDLMGNLCTCVGVAVNVALL